MSAGCPARTPIELKDTDAIVRGSNAEIEQETIKSPDHESSAQMKHIAARPPDRRAGSPPLKTMPATLVDGSATTDNPQTATSRLRNATTPIATSTTAATSRIL
jgi:hypothetical protein